MIRAALALALALFAVPALAKACPTATDALHAAISQNLTGDTAFMARAAFRQTPFGCRSIRLQPFWRRHSPRPRSVSIW